MGHLIERMKQRLEEGDAGALRERAARTIPARLRAPAFAVVADLLLADGKMDARERRFLQQLTVDLRLPIDVATTVIDAMRVKNRL